MPTSIALRSVTRRLSAVGDGARAVALWSLAYLAVNLSGQPFSTAYLGYGWQMLPWDVLSADPIRSVWYLHTQPPLWNLSLGVLSWVSPLSDSFTLHLFLFLLGAALVWVLHSVVVGFGVGRHTAVVLTVIITVNPEVLRNAFEPTYEMAAAVFLALVVRSIQRATQQHRPREVVWCTVWLTALVLTRSLYHPLVLVVIVAALCLSLRRHLTRRIVAVVILIPLVAVGGWMAKNQALFGRPTLSTWTGMNLQRSTIPVVGAEALAALHADGSVSDVALIGPFRTYDEYRAAVPPCAPTHDHPALTVLGHDEPGYGFISNFNYECYLPVFDQAADDFWAVARAYPGAWLDARIFSTKLTFATSNLPGESDSRVFRALDDIYRVARLDVRISEDTSSWSTPYYAGRTDGFPVAVAVAALYLLIGVYAVRMLGCRVLARRRRVAPPPPIDAAMLAVVFLTWYTVVVGVIAELGEQSRFRSMTDPIALTLGLIVIVRVAKRWRARASH